MVNMNFTGFLFSLAVGFALSLVFFYLYVKAKKSGLSRTNKTYSVLANILLLIAIICILPIVFILFEMLRGRLV